MEAWSLNNKDIETYNLMVDRDILEEIKTPIQNRSNFRYDNEIVTIPRYFYRFIGCHAEINDYLTWVYNLDFTLSSFDKLYIKITKGFEKCLPSDYISRLGAAWQRIKMLADFKSNDIVNNLDKFNLLPKPASKILSKQLRENFMALIDYYFEVNDDLIDENEFKNIIFYTAYWSCLYFEKLFDNFDYTNINPKILFYGDIQTYEIFFLLFLGSLGTDIIYLNTLDDGPFDKVDPKGIFTYKHELVRRAKNIEFPSNTRNARITTIAKQAEREVDAALHSDDSGFYKPFQLADCKLNIRTLSTSYSEIPIWIKQEALIRDGWNVSGNQVFLSNIFAKISGTPESQKNYLKSIKELTELPSTVFFERAPFSARRSDEHQKYRQVVTYSNGTIYLDKDALLRSSWWPYSRLRTGLQELLAEKIAFIINEGIIRDKTSKNDEETAIKVFSKLLHVDQWFIDLLMKFDYPKAVPKLIIFNYIGPTGQSLSLFDAVMMLLANCVGMDVLLYTPSGFQDIENFIDPSLKLYDLHRLESVDTELEFKFGAMHFIKKLFN